MLFLGKAVHLYQKEGNSAQRTIIARSHHQREPVSPCNCARWGAGCTQEEGPQIADALLELNGILEIFDSADLSSSEEASEAAWV